MKSKIANRSAIIGTSMKRRGGKFEIRNSKFEIDLSLNLPGDFTWE